MIPGNARIIACPYCGREKKLMTLISGNTIGARYWSDNKMEAPMLPKVSPVQKCNGCGKYYFTHRQGFRESQDHTSERGLLSYPEWKEAYQQFTGGQSDDISGKDLTMVRFWLIQAYNDYFHRDVSAERQPSPEEQSFIARIILGFIDALDWQSEGSPLLKAELYREAGEMGKCAETLNAIDYAGLNGSAKQLYQGIMLRLKSDNTQVFELKAL